MMKSRTRTEKNTSISSHIAFGVLLSLASLFLMSVILAILVEKEVISMAAMTTFGMGIHATNVFFGSLLGAALEKGRTAIVSAIVTVIYLGTLLCVNMLVFSSGITGIVTTVISACVGGLMAVAVKGYKCKGKKHRVKLRSR